MTGKQVREAIDSLAIYVLYGASGGCSISRESLGWHRLRLIILRGNRSVESTPASMKGNLSLSRIPGSCDHEGQYSL